MIRTTAMIIGGGPSGAACALELKRRNVNTLLLEKKEFPRFKPCAGWITPGVLEALDVKPKAYPHLMKRFRRLNFHLGGLNMAVPTRQYAIRRVEFDQWMLDRTGVPVIRHTARKIQKARAEKNQDGFIIDGQYQCRFLIGAGGTHCPVEKTFFAPAAPRSKADHIAAVEKEYRADAVLSEQCHLWFLNNHLPGYAWYLPKGDGWINIGIGGKSSKLKQQGRTIMDHWHTFVAKLKSDNFIREIPKDPMGHTYYLMGQDRRDPQTLRQGNAFIVGDAAGLSTLDMGEGIQAAIKSGQWAAGVIANSGHTELYKGPNDKPHAKTGPSLKIPRFSLTGILKASL